MSSLCPGDIPGPTDGEIRERVVGRGLHFTEKRISAPHVVLKRAAGFPCRTGSVVSWDVNPGRSRRERRDVVREPERPDGSSLPRFCDDSSLRSGDSTCGIAYHNPADQSPSLLHRPPARRLDRVKLIPI